jgi:hypothetical protein
VGSSADPELALALHVSTEEQLQQQEEENLPGMDPNKEAI